MAFCRSIKITRIMDLIYCCTAYLNRDEHSLLYRPSLGFPPLKSSVTNYGLIITATFPRPIDQDPQNI